MARSATALVAPVAVAGVGDEVEHLPVRGMSLDKPQPYRRWSALRDARRQDWVAPTRATTRRRGRAAATTPPPLSQSPIRRTRRASWAARARRRRTRPAPR